MCRDWDGDCVDDDYDDVCADDSYDTEEDEEQSCGCANGCYDCLGISRGEFY